MNKFKIGDIIIGNKDAEEYVYTTCGTKCKVISYDTSVLSFLGDIRVEIMEGLNKGGQYTVWSKCFDLYTPPHQGKILIMVDEKDPNKIVARDLISGKKAEAKCNPKDEWDFEKGAKLAFSRLYPEPEKKEENKPWTGKVICIRNTPYCALFTEGKVYTVDKGHLHDNVFPWTFRVCYSLEDVNDMVKKCGWPGTEFIEYKGGLE